MCFAKARRHSSQAYPFLPQHVPSRKPLLIRISQCSGLCCSLAISRVASGTSTSIEHSPSTELRALYSSLEAGLYSHSVSRVSYRDPLISELATSQNVWCRGSFEATKPFWAKSRQATCIRSAMREWEQSRAMITFFTHSAFEQIWTLA